ncbi:MFS transporter [Staphylococcus massiliensis]|uniref:Efflux transporter n=1 Tax=Staphylococcus massiliensis S46 TaxID=1229783 RepID=K9AS36_9STAP|nr:MFS transporter [Staphylococcus massiliensis]EKU50139.1 efflux transporter [Staphylococcus massiliensis S46]MCG3400441.1 MFS transporter [Staphylococcus massiliensis]MCG3412875.1 MFS transporter [Staphylococcus massiliensis]POA00833.1 MFS transporter [Staphylococcus massiliensis CCUG 55927]
MKKKSFDIVALFLLLGVFMSALDNGIISAALTTINNSFDIDAQMGSWGITIYTLGMAVTTPIAGKLADMYGRKKVFIAEVVLFGLGSLLVALSPNYIFFIVARLIQSLGGGGLFVIASSHIISTYSKEKQGSMLGGLGAMNGIASVLGPNIGSLLINVTGTWHWLFLINVPFAILIVFFVAFKMKETQDKVKTKIDKYAILMFSISTLLVMFAINNVQTGNIAGSILSFAVIGLFILAILGYGIMIFIEYMNENKDVDSFLPFKLLKNPTFSVTLIMGILSGMLIGAIIFIPSFVENVLNVKADNSGFWMTPLALASGVGASMGGKIVDKKGPIFALISASIISIIGYGGLALFTFSPLPFFIFSIIAGIGFGFTIGAPMTVLATRSAHSNKNNSTVIGTLSVSRQIGITISPTIFSTFIAIGFSKMGEKIKDNMMEAGFTMKDVPASVMRTMSEKGSSQGHIIDKIKDIPNPDLKDAMLNGIESATHLAYMPIFLTAAIASLGILALVLIFKKNFEEAK